MIWPSKVGMVGLSIKKNRKSISSQKNSKKGFTLVELIVVLVIIAIMAAAIAPALLGYIDHANEKKYIEKANECLKASQSVISDTYNDSSNSISMEKRYSAADAAKVKILGYNDDLNKKDGTSFVVWTSKQLVATGETLSDGTLADGTKAIADNMGSYTVAYAAYDPGENVDKFFVYDGKEWTAVDKPSDEEGNISASYNLVAAATASVDAKYKDNLINMWPFIDDTAYADGKTPNKEDWKAEVDDAITKTVRFHLTSDIRKHGVVFELNGTELTSTEKEYIDIEFSMDSTKAVTSAQCISGSLTGGSEIKELENNYKIKLERGFKDLCWSKSKGPVNETYAWTSSDESLLNQIFVEGVTEFYACTDKEKTSKEVTFKAYKPQTLSINGGASCSITLWKYDNDYDNTYDMSSDLNNDAATKFAALSAIPASGYELDGWGRETTTTTSGYELDGSALKKYNADIEEIWNKVFLEWPAEDSEIAPTFVGNILMDKTATFKADAHSEFKSNAGDLVLTYKYAEIPIETVVDTFEEKYTTHGVVMKDGFQFLGWEDVSDTTKTFDADGGEIARIKEYVKGQNKTEFTFNIRTKEIIGAKLVAESSDDFKALVGTTNTEYAKVKSVIRDSYATGVAALGDTFTNNTTNTNGAVKGEAGDSHTALIDINSGDINKFAILWDGKADDYPVPVFAYSKTVDGGYEIHWFCFDNNDPDVYGDFSNTFSNFTNCNFGESKIDSWNMANCENVASMFENCTALKTGDIVFKKWTDMSSVTSMANMFKGCSNMAFTAVDFTGVQLDALTTMANWVDNCANLQAITLDKVNSPALTNITNIATNYIENNSRLESFSAKSWKAGSVIGFANYFRKKYNLKDVDFSGTANDMTDLSGVTSLYNLFCVQNKGVVSDKSLEIVSFAYADLSSVTDARYMFVARENDSETVDVPISSVSFEGADLSSLSLTDGMFYHLKFATSINLNTKTTLAPTSCVRMFDKCFVLTSVEGLESMDTSNVTTMDHMFYQNRAFTNFDFTKWDYSSVTDMGYMFFGAGFEEISFNGKSMPNLKTVTLMFGGKNDKDGGVTEHAAVKRLYFSNCTMNNANLTSFKSLLKDCNKLEEAHFEGFTSTSITDMSYLFQNCENLSTANFKGCTLSSVITVAEMFNACSSLSSVNLTEAKMPSVTNVSNMFRQASVTTVTLKDCDMSELVSAKAIVFNNNTIRTFNAEGWKIPKVADLSQMFMNKTALEVANFENAVTKPENETSHLTTMKQMFQGCTKLRDVNMACSDTSEVTTMEYMFSGCSNLVYVNGFDLINVKKLNSTKYMFSNCTSLQSITFTIYSEGMADRTKDKGLSMEYMFNGCTSLSSVKFVGTKAGTQGTCISGLLSWKALFNNCTSYDLNSLEETLNNINFDTDVKPTGDNYLFYNNHSKNSVGYNSLFEYGKCHSSLNAANAPGKEITIHTDMGYDLKMYAYKDGSPGTAWNDAGTRLNNMNPPNPN